MSTPSRYIAGNCGRRTTRRRRPVFRERRGRRCLTSRLPALMTLAVVRAVSTLPAERLFHLLPALRARLHVVPPSREVGQSHRPSSAAPLEDRPPAWCATTALRPLRQRPVRRLPQAGPVLWRRALGRTGTEIADPPELPRRLRMRGRGHGQGHRERDGQSPPRDHSTT
jgi:hypothetical protein